MCELTQKFGPSNKLQACVSQEIPSQGRRREQQIDGQKADRGGAGEGMDVT